MLKKTMIIMLTVSLVMFNNIYTSADDNNVPIIKTKVVIIPKPKPKPLKKKPKIIKKVTPKPKAIIPKKVVSKSRITPSRGDSIDTDNIILLAKLIQSEALSESYEGKLWVGAVVVNRMRVYNKSMSEIIYQQSQFSGIHGDLFNSNPSRSCVGAAREILNGNNPDREILYFANLNICSPSWVNEVREVAQVDSHTFYRK